MNKKILLTLLMTVIFLMSGCSSNDSNGYYNGIKWGSTIAKVEQKLGDNIVVSDDKENILQVIENFENIDGLQACEMYYFENNILCKITIIPSFLPNESSLSDDELNQQLHDKFVKAYGKCSSSDSREQVWETKNSIITLLSTNYIRYEPIKE